MVVFRQNQCFTNPTWTFFDFPLFKWAMLNCAMSHYEPE